MRSKTKANGSIRPPGRVWSVIDQRSALLMTALGKCGRLLPAVVLAAAAASCDLQPDKGDSSPEQPVSAVVSAELGLADAAFRDGRFVKAADLYREAGRHSEAGGDSVGQWQAQVKLAYALGLLGRREEADAEFVKAMQLATGDASRVGWTHVRNGSIYSRQGKFAEAQAKARLAQELAEVSGDRKLAATAMYLLGETYSLTGRYTEALQAGQERLEIERSLGASDSDVAHALSQIAIDLRRLGRHTEAAGMLQQALAVHRRLDNSEGQARVLYTLGTVHAATGDFPAATAFMAESLESIGHTENPRGLALILNGLADIYLRAGNDRAAEEHLARALALNRSSRQPYGEATNLLSISRLALKSGNFDAAEQSALAAGVLADQHGYERQRSAVRALLAHIASGRGDGEAALHFAAEALAIAGTLDDPEAQFEALEARAVAAEATGDEDTAGAWLEAIDLLESWRGRLALGDLRMSIAEPRWSVYEGAIRSLLDQSRSADAFAVTERARARLLLEIMAERDASAAARTGGSSIRLQLRERLTERAANADPSAAGALDAEIARLQGSLAVLGQQAMSRNAASGAARYPAPALAADVQTRLLGPGRALLSFFWGERDVYGWWITATEVRAVRLGSSRELGARLDFLRASLEQPLPGSSWTIPAEAAFKALLAPLTPTPVEEILVVADGPLAHIPLEALLPDQDAEPLGATTRIVYGPSASVLLGLTTAGQPQAWERSILIVGNPTFGNRPAAAMRQPDDAPAPLPYAAEEARVIYDLFRSEGADLLVGERATLRAWNALEPARYRYLHFAAHALVSAASPQQTHILLAGDRMDLAAIRELDLRSELVTLSACETAEGYRVRGEGIIGLSHAFLAAGARAALVTLWRIDDERTAGFMQQFYSRLYEGSSPAEALLAVRREHISAGFEPAHWAPFVLVGEL